MITFSSANRKTLLQPFSKAKNKFLIIAILWLCFQFITSAYSQDSLIKTRVVSSLDTNERNKVSEDSSYVVNFTPAAFPGGKTEWIKYLAHNLLVPEEMRGNKFNRSIVVKFTVDEKGKLINFDDAGHDALKREAIRVVKSSGKWIPAYSNSTPVTSECERIITLQWNWY